MITIPGFLLPNKYDSSDINHCAADCKIATSRHVFILGLDFFGCQNLQERDSRKFSFLIRGFHGSEVSLLSQAALAARLERAED